MNWTTPEIILQIIGSLAVVISVVYLAKQVKDGTKNLKTSMRNSVFNSLMDWNHSIMADPELAWIFQFGCKDFETMNIEQKARFVHVMYSFFKLFENIYLHYIDNSIPEDVWQNNRKIFDAYIVTQGAQTYWKQRKPIFHPDFQNYIENIKTSEVPAGHIISETAGR